MGKILLCGNGFNIEFEEKFRLDEFINLLLDETKLKNFALRSENFFKPKLASISTFAIPTFNISDYYKKIEDFCWVVKKCRAQINASKKNFSKNGVESVFKQLFQEVENYLAFDEENDLNYKEFENTFKELFFTYIWQLQNQSLPKIINDFDYKYSKLKSKLEEYMRIITLNYDNVLEKMVPKSARDIIHWHGMIKEKQDGTLSYKTCLLDTIRNPKSLETFKQISLFKNYQKYKGNYELDIVGLNPMNDENVFALFINSQICHKINFYYHDKSDLMNLNEILEKIQNIWLEIEQDKNGKNKVILKKNDENKRFDFIKHSNKYVINFYIIDYVWDDFEGALFIDDKSNGSIEINLIDSSKFWNECKTDAIDKNIFEQNIFDTF